KIKFDGAAMIDVEFDDRNFTGSHYGHLCRAQVRPDKVTVVDERDGSQSNAMVELKKDPVKNKAEMGKLYASHSATFPLANNLETGKWYTLVVETVGDEMRVTIDGKPSGFLKSPGIGHATKSKIELGVAGKSGFYDDIKVWNAEPAK
ncbi:MAG: signal peptide-domain containing protein, partial [Verrucomicrobiaceae bacterium]|nr:signal peptide-domain containing protein [Verrucomicrobiaceae bacterium]